MRKSFVAAGLAIAALLAGSCGPRMVGPERPPDRDEKIAAARLDATKRLRDLATDDKAWIPVASVAVLEPTGPHWPELIKPLTSSMKTTISLPIS